MMDEVWEISSGETQRIFSILSFLRQSTCPYIGRPIVRVYEEGNKKDDEKRCASASPRHLLLSYPLSERRMMLHQFLQLDGSRSLEVRLSLAYQLVQAVAFLHTCGVSHQFLSSDVVAVELTPEPTIRLTRFYSCTTSSDCSGSYICVRNYRPPEVVLQLNGIQPKAVDCWALGCLLFEVYTGSPAFSLEVSGGNFRVQLLKQQLEETVKVIGRLEEDDIPPGCPERVSQYLVGLNYDASICSRMLAVGTAEEAESWMTLVRPLLHFNFLMRSTANDVLQHKIFAGLSPPVKWPVPCKVLSQLQELLD